MPLIVLIQTMNSIHVARFAGWECGIARAQAVAGCGLGQSHVCGKGIGDCGIFFSVAISRHANPGRPYPQGRPGTVKF